MGTPSNTANVWIRMALPAAILMSMLVIYFPLPTMLMDFLLATNLAASMVLLLTTVFVKSPLELRVFPSLLLVTTLMRLSLNVATTRLILGNGATDKELAAGQVVNGFSQFIAGDSIVVGTIIFAILFIVQFIVITKGATRIGEVAARFALDSLPGRQMAIDADLANGSINWEEAQRRRRALIQYADFQGSMDGASKYVRGDAIAGLAITFINVIGGIVQGSLHGLSFPESASIFTRLTIGDGLVSQFPALLISIAAGLLITRGTDESDLPSDAARQSASSPMALWIAAGFLALLPLANLPVIPLWALAAGLGWLGFVVSSSQKRQESTHLSNVAAPKESRIERYLETDQIELQVGLQLLPLCNSQMGGTVVADISGLRNEIALELGIVLPKVRIRDNMQLPPNHFRVLLEGNMLFQGAVEMDRILFVHTRDTFPVQNARAQFPWAPYALWGHPSSPENRSSYQSIAPAKAIVLTLRWLVIEYADQLLTRDATHELIEETRKSYPRLVGDTIPDVITLGQLQRTFKALLKDGIAIRPMHLILESINEHRAVVHDVPGLVGQIREDLQRQTAQRLSNVDGKVTCFGISEELAESLEKSLATHHDESTVSGKFSATIRRNLRTAIQSGVTHLLALGHRPVLLVPHSQLALIKQCVDELHPKVFVMSEREVPNPQTINLIAEITPGDIEQKGASKAA